MEGFARHPEFAVDMPETMRERLGGLVTKSGYLLNVA